ncbi:MAG: hypothetical protein HC840_17970 [Leptolyngbyaceae cyanobacterium RM2_2_4]|nr:hypothetical protein [Leptolyngbyaceae cyanobacterium SM1_4_3]NJO51017.1 hypothetical protein [Leptolyngbyaceae cyanobacterium RM2_2_4]
MEREIDRFVEDGNEGRSAFLGRAWARSIALLEMGMRGDRMLEKMEEGRSIE